MESVCYLVPKVVALYDYTSRVEGDISFRKGDVMIQLETR